MNNLFFEFNQNISQQELDAYSKLTVLYEDKELYTRDGYGNFSIYLGDSYLNFEIDLESGRISSFMGQYFVDKIKEQKLKPLKDYQNGILQLRNDCFSQKGCGVRMNFKTNICYDKLEKLLLIGEFDSDLPLLHFFKNGFVQLDNEGQIKSIMFTNININLEKGEEFSK